MFCGTNSEILFMILINNNIKKTLKRIGEINIEISNYDDNPLSKHNILPDLYRKNLEDEKTILNQKLETLKSKRDYGMWNKVVWNILVVIFAGVVTHLIILYIF